MRTHLRSQYLATLSGEVVEVIEEHANEAPTTGATVFISPRGGAETEPPSDATAYPHRDAAHHLLVEARWDDPDADAEHVSWVDSFHDAVAPFMTGDVAMNFLTEDEIEARVRAAYGENYERLIDVKQRWDPENLFRANQYVEPTD